MSFVIKRICILWLLAGYLVLDRQNYVLKSPGFWPSDIFTAISWVHKKRRRVRVNSGQLDFFSGARRYLKTLKEPGVYASLDCIFAGVVVTLFSLLWDNWLAAYLLSK